MAHPHGGAIVGAESHEEIISRKSSDPELTDDQDDSHLVLIYEENAMDD